MSSRGRSVTPSRRYGDIMGSIFSNGSGELDEKTKSSVSQVKKMFRERRQKNSPRRSVGRSQTPERRQTPSSPIRQYTDSRSGGRPPTPERSKSNGRFPSPHWQQYPSQNEKSTIDSSAREPFQNKGKGISVRPLSLSPQKRRDRSVDSSKPVETLTKRVVKQVSKEMGPTTKTGQNVVETKTPEPFEQELNQSQNDQIPQDVKQMKQLIQTQGEQIKFYENCLKKRLYNAEQLSLDLQLSKKNESKLSLELEIHDLKYSMYDDYRRMMDRQRLNNIYEKQGDEIEFENEFSLKSYDAFSKLNHLDHLYEKSKLEAESRFSILQEEYNRIVSARFASPSEKTRGTSTTLTLELLENKIKILESENSKYSIDIKRKEEELDKAKSLRNNSTAERKENSSNIHNVEKQTLQNKIIALETEIGFTSGHIDDKTRTRRYRALEKNLNDYVAEIMGLEDKLKAKEKIISELKERKLTVNVGLEKQNDRGSKPSVSTAKWYEQSNKGSKGQSTPTDRSHGGNAPKQTTKSFEPHKIEGGNGIQGSRSFGADNIEAVATDIQHLRSRVSKTIGGDKIEFRKRINGKGRSSSSSRIAMLRKRLDALANDHSSVGTDDTQFSNKTSPS